MRKIIGHQIDDGPQEHSIECPACDQRLDMHDREEGEWSLPPTSAKDDFQFALTRLNAAYLSKPAATWLGLGVDDLQDALSSCSTG
jgi:hypothetical protein